MRFISLIGLTLAFAAPGSAADTSAVITEFSPCRIGIAPRTALAECATVTVPFTHGLEANSYQGSKGSLPETITLEIARISARSKQSDADPVTILAGGPGQGARDSWTQIASAFQPTLASRDVYLIDQRGTGASERMDCPEAPPSSGVTLDLDKVRESAQACVTDQDLPTQWFTTSVAVQDLDTVRQLLEIDTWNLYGISYGTRVALHYLRRFPEHTRSVVLDAVVPPQKPIGPEVPIYSQQSLDRLFERCEQDEGCANAFPNLSEKTNALFESLRETPRIVQYENLSRGSLDSITFTDQHLAMSVRLLSYSAYGHAILPSMLYDAADNNNLAPFARQVALQETQLGDTMATGMHAAVICTEDAPFINAQIDRTEMQATFLGDLILDAMVVGCEPWPLGVIDEDFHEPVVSDVPVLALSGSVDPITPPSYAEQAIVSLSRAHHIVNENQSHMQAPFGCMPTVMAQFFSETSPENLNLTCLERLTAPALFVDANGPLP